MIGVNKIEISTDLWSEGYKKLFDIESKVVEETTNGNLYFPEELYNHLKESDFVRNLNLADITTNIDFIENAGIFLNKFHSGVFAEAAVDILSRGNDFYEFFGYIITRRNVLLASKSQGRILEIIKSTGDNITQEELDVTELIICDYAFQKLCKMSENEFGQLTFNNTDREDLIKIFMAFYALDSQRGLLEGSKRIGMDEVQIKKREFLKSKANKWKALAGFLEN